MSGNAGLARAVSCIGIFTVSEGTGTTLRYGNCAVTRSPTRIPVLLPRIANNRPSRLCRCHGRVRRTESDDANAVAGRTGPAEKSNDPLSSRFSRTARDTLGTKWKYGVLPLSSSSRPVRLSSCGVSTNNPRDATRDSELGRLVRTRPIANRMNAVTKRTKTKNLFRSFLIALIAFVHLGRLFTLFLAPDVSAPFRMAPKWIRRGEGSPLRDYFLAAQPS